MKKYRRQTAPETAYAEGARLYREGKGLSQLWSDCSDKNFHDFDEVLRGWFGDSERKLDLEAKDCQPRKPAGIFRRIADKFWRTIA